MIKFWISIFAIYSLPLNASTFVGNGGNAGDLDLSIALAEIHETFEKLEEGSAILCQCPDELAENELCTVLRSLKREQANFCKETLLSQKASISALSSKDSDIRFTWHDGAFKAKEGDGSTRLVDAVSQREKRVIILNRTRFLEMPHSFRIALLTHELFHFVKIGNDFVSDEKEIAPFKEGKSLLDTLGAATAMQAFSLDVTSDFGHLKRVSRGYKKYIFQLDLKSIGENKNSAGKLLKKGSSAGQTFAFEYKPKNIGFRLGLDDVYHESVSRGAITVEETINLFTLGIGYHWFPISARLSRWSEAHISAFLEPIYGKAKYHVRDEVLSIKDKSPVAGVQLTLQIHVPIVNGFWGTIGQQLRYTEYQYRDLDIKIKQTQEIFYLGGAYAF